jgi:hypothetical protein
MKTTRNVLTLALLALVGSAVSADPVPVDGQTGLYEDTMPPSRDAQALGAKPSTLREGAVWAYNVVDCDVCEDGFNGAWSDPDCFDPDLGCTRSMYILPMGYTPFDARPYDAPLYDPDGVPDSGDEWRTDIFFDDYQADAGVWGDTGALQSMVAFHGNAWTINNYGSGVDKTFVFRFLWFSGDGATFYSGWVWNLEALDGDGWHYHIWAGDLDEPLDPADTFEIPYEGLICFDYDNETLEGHDDGGAWNYFIGGDILNALFPYPTDLYALGFNDELSWLAAGIDDPNLDEMWDGEVGLSYSDILNTGFLIDWAFGGTNPDRERGHGTPTAMGIVGGSGCPGDLDGDGDTDQSDLGILLAAFQINGNGDLDGDGDTDQSDLGILLADFGCV